jgi:hypothetical protein
VLVDLSTRERDEKRKWNKLDIILLCC